MSKADDIFYREFAAVLVALLVFALFSFFVARVIGANAFDKMLSAPQAVLERIEPVGSERVGTPGETVAAATMAPAPQPAAAPATTAGAGKSGSEVYNSACIACHSSGVAGAPKTGDKAAWEPRIAQGMDAMLQSAIKGKNAMPPKGGNMSLSDEEVKRALEHMLEQTGVSPG